jgi:mannose-6-phosphate isomerase-like protein (cupin superfamily)
MHMNVSEVLEKPLIAISRSELPPHRTPWGEEARIRLSSSDTHGALSIVDITVPPGFGPPRHLHHREDEILRVVNGRLVVWTPDRSFALEPGEVISLPKGVPHTWRSYGDQPVRFVMDCLPGGFENIYPLVVEHQVMLDDIVSLAKIAVEFGIEVVGPPLNDEDAELIIWGVDI